MIVSLDEGLAYASIGHDKTDGIKRRMGRLSICTSSSFSLFSLVLFSLEVSPFFIVYKLNSWYADYMSAHELT